MIRSSDDDLQSFTLACTLFHLTPHHDPVTHVYNARSRLLNHLASQSRFLFSFSALQAWKITATIFN